MKMKLVDISKKISKGSTPRGKVNYSKNEDNYFLRVTDMVDLANVYNSEFTLSNEDITKNKMKIWPINTVLVSIEGTVGKISILKKKMSFNQAVAGIIPNEEIINPRYLMYYLRTTPVFSGILKGTIMPALRLSDLSEIEIEVPNMKIQNKMVSIVDSITNKIDLNNKINNNLYELAIKYLKEMQSNDEVTLSTFGKIQGGYAFKSKDLLDTRTNNRIIKIKNLRNEISADVINSQFVEDEVIEKLDNKFKIQKGNVAIAMTGAELGKTGFIYGFDNYYLNQRVGLVRGITREKELYLNFLLLSQEFQDLLNSKGYGSAQPNISTTDIENILIQNIEDKNLAKFYEIVNPIYAKIILNCEENLNLEQLRDSLLPKLMNGEINLDNIEI